MGIRLLKLRSTGVKQVLMKFTPESCNGKNSAHDPGKMVWSFVAPFDSPLAICSLCAVSSLDHLSFRSRSNACLLPGLPFPVRFHILRHCRMSERFFERGCYARNSPRCSLLLLWILIAVPAAGLKAASSHVRHILVFHDRAVFHL